MADTTRPFSNRDGNQVLQATMNDVDGTITTNGFLVSLVGRQINLTITSTNTANDTEIYAFSEKFGANPLYTFTIVYTDGTRSTLLYANRSA